jgi:hypothetical protein
MSSAHASSGATIKVLYFSLAAVLLVFVVMFSLTFLHA